MADIPPQANVQLGIESRISGKMFLESTEHHRTLLLSLNVLGCEMGSICVLLRLRCHLLLCGFLFFSLCSALFLLGNEPREPATLFDESKAQAREAQLPSGFGCGSSSGNLVARPQGGCDRSSRRRGVSDEVSVARGVHRYIRWIHLSDGANGRARAASYMGFR